MRPDDFAQSVAEAGAVVAGAAAVVGAVAFVGASLGGLVAGAVVPEGLATAAQWALASAVGVPFLAAAWWVWPLGRPRPRRLSSPS